jgi:hypothetical protein
MPAINNEDPKTIYKLIDPTDEIMKLKAIIDPTDEIMKLKEIISREKRL